MNIPRHYMIVSGRGCSTYPLVAFDNALIDAGIGDYNLVKVSSILPIGCQYENCINIEKGSIVYAAYASATVIYKQERTVSVAVAVPINDAESGVIFEATSNNSSVKNDVYDMCTEAMAKRNKIIREIKSGSISVIGEKDKFVCGISAVIMW